MELKKLPDIQNKKDERGLPIPKVGIRGLHVPFRVYTKGNETQTTDARCSMYVDLNRKVKGINMSRMPIMLTEYIEKTMSFELIKEMLEVMKIRMGSEHSYIKMSFKYKVLVEAPKSRELGYKYYDVVMEGTWIDNVMRLYLTVTVPYISICPCSVELCKDLRNRNLSKGYPHQQRSSAKVTIELGKRVWIEDLIERIESAVKVTPLPVLKREDEQQIARDSYKTNLFVEDAIREIALWMDTFDDDHVRDWVIVCNHEESIHQHNAVAIMRKGKGLQ